MAAVSASDPSLDSFMSSNRSAGTLSLMQESSSSCTLESRDYPVVIAMETRRSESSEGIPPAGTFGTVAVGSIVGVGLGVAVTVGFGIRVAVGSVVAVGIGSCTV